MNLCLKLIYKILLNCISKCCHKYPKQISDHCRHCQIARDSEQLILPLSHLQKFHEELRISYQLHHTDKSLLFSFLQIATSITARCHRYSNVIRRMRPTIRRPIQRPPLPPAVAAAAAAAMRQQRRPAPQIRRIVAPAAISNHGRPPCTAPPPGRRPHCIRPAARRPTWRPQPAPVTLPTPAATTTQQPQRRSHSASSVRTTRTSWATPRGACCTRWPPTIRKSRPSPSPRTCPRFSPSCPSSIRAKCAPPISKKSELQCICEIVGTLNDTIVRSAG